MRLFYATGLLLPIPLIVIALLLSLIATLGEEA